MGDEMNYCELYDLHRTTDGPDDCNWTDTQINDSTIL